MSVAGLGVYGIPEAILEYSIKRVLGDQLVLRLEARLRRLGEIENASGSKG